MISVLIVDDYASVRKGLRFLLESTSDMEVVATASNGIDAMARVRFSCPDVAVIDISMPVMDGLETTRQLNIRCQLTRVIMLSIHDSPEYIQRSLDVGAFGYVLKDTIGNDLLKAIRTVYKGRHYFSQKIIEIASKHLHRIGNDTWVV